MAALDFPASPSNGQQYTGPGGVVWTWDGSKWVTQGIATAYLPLAGGTMTGVLGLTPGTAAAPAVNFGTANTGLYGAVSSIGLSVGGAAQLTVDAAAVTAALPVVLPGAPTLALHAATKGYVDTKAPLASPTFTGTVTIPAGASIAGYYPTTAGTLTGDVTITKNGPIFSLNRTASGQNCFITGQANGSGRWQMILGDASTESGSNAGSDFSIGRLTDAGAFNGNPFFISRNTGRVVITNDNGGTGAGSGTLLLQSQSVSVSAYLTMISNGQRSWGLGAEAANSGRLHIVDNTSAAIRIVINPDGQCFCTNGTWQSLSDRNTKRDIEPYTRGLADLVQLQPVSFFYNGALGSQDDGQRQIGLVAQDVEPIVPEVVGQMEAPILGGEPGAMVHTLDSGRLMFAVLNALKEIDARLATLEGGTPTP